MRQTTEWYEGPYEGFANQRQWATMFRINNIEYFARRLALIQQWVEIVDRLPNEAVGNTKDGAVIEYGLIVAEAMALLYDVTMPTVENERIPLYGDDYRALVREVLGWAS